LSYQEPREGQEVRIRILNVVAIVLGGWLAGCGRSSDPGLVGPDPQLPGTLEVTVTVEGTRPDVDGYFLSLSDAPGETVSSAGGTVRFADLPPGSHSVRLHGLAPNCRVQGANPRLVNLHPNKTFKVQLLVRCPGPGHLRIVTATSGVEVDPDGYTLILESSSVHEKSIGLNDSLLIEGEEIQEIWAVRLTGLAPNCVADPHVVPTQVVSLDPLEVRLLEDSTVRVQFQVGCLPRFAQMAFTDGDDIYVLPTIGEEALKLTGRPSTDMAPALSPYRSRVAFMSNRAGPDEFSFDLYAVNTDGGDLVRLTNTPGVDVLGSQAWSPDGTRIAFGYSDGAGTDIYLMNADGTGVLQLTDDGSIECPPAWSPTGEWLAFCKAGAIYRMAPAPGSPMVRVVGDGFDPTWSPDGTMIAFSIGFVWDFPLADLAVVRADGTGFFQLHPNLENAEVALSPSWSPDGSWIAFARSRLTGWELVMVPLLADRFGEVVRIGSGFAPSWR
jgi:hypothetical protein